MANIRKVKIRVQDLYTISSAIDAILHVDANNVTDMSCNILSDIRSAINALITARCNQDISAQYYMSDYNSYLQYKTAAESSQKDADRAIYCVASNTDQLIMNKLKGGDNH